MNELTMNLKTDSKVPLYEQIYNYIKSDIQNGRISYGEKLPSTRALARHLEISRRFNGGWETEKERGESENE